MQATKEKIELRVVGMKTCAGDLEKIRHAVPTVCWKNHMAIRGCRTGNVQYWTVPLQEIEEEIFPPITSDADADYFAKYAEILNKDAEDWLRLSAEAIE